MISCKSCGKRIEPGNAYGDGRGGGPWHRLCVPQNPDADAWEQTVRREMRALEAESRTHQTRAFALEDWPTPPLPSAQMSVLSSDAPKRDTGLLDSSGRPIERSASAQGIGFLRFAEETS